jgi:hypothetical protein
MIFCRYNTVHVPCGISIQTSPVWLPLDGWGARMRDRKGSNMNCFNAKEDWKTHWEETLFNWYINIQIMEFIIWKSGSNIVIEKSRNIKSKTSDLKATCMLMKQRHLSVKYKMVWWRASIWWMVDTAKNNISWRVVSFIGGGTGKKNRTATSHWQTLSHNVMSSTPRLSGDDCKVVIFHIRGIARN